MADARRVPVRVVPAQDLDRAARGGVHQGVVAEVEGAPDYSVQDLVAAAPGPALLVVLDGIEDPHNVGAILRTVDAAGADGVAIEVHHQPELALSDGPQALTPALFSDLMARLQPIAAAVGRTL